jgi:subfamily B ATP-binding cassette protein MsbA
MMNKLLSTYIAEENKGRLKLILLPLLNELFLASLIFLYSFAVAGIIAGEGLKWLGISIGFILAFMLCYYYGTFFSIACRTKFEIFLKNRLLHAFFQMDDLAFEQLSDGKITEIVRNISLLSGALTTFPALYFKWVKLSVLLFGIGLFLGLKVLAINLVLVVITFGAKNVAKKIAPYQTRLMQREEVISEQMIETVDGIATIKSYGLENRLKQRFEQALHFYLKESLEKKLVENLLGLFFRYFNIIIAAVSLLATLSFSDERQVGFLISSTMFSSYLAQSIGELIQVNQEKTKIQTAYAKYASLLSPEPLPANLTRHQEKVTSFQVQHLFFERDNQAVIQDFSYDFSNHGLYLIKGESGKGKSTLLKLLAGLYQPSAGQILLNQQEKHQAQVIYMPQQTDYLQGTIAENIFFSDEKGEETDSYAIVADFDTSSGLSGGQVQLVNLVRALMSDKAILILDEPLSALDLKNKERFKAIIAREKRDRLIILTTHDTALDEIADAMIEL